MHLMKSETISSSVAPQQDSTSAASRPVRSLPILQKNSVASPDSDASVSSCMQLTPMTHNPQNLSGLFLNP